MDIVKIGKQKTSDFRQWFTKASWKKRLLLIGIILGVLWFGRSLVLGNRQEQPQYQTAQAEKGTLITSVSASGTISSASRVSITTNATGIVKNVYVKAGDTIKEGAKIADLTLDTNSRQRQAAAWASYLSVKNSLDSAEAKINSLQAALFKANQTFINDAVARGLATNDPTYIQENALWLQAEADYKNQAAVIIQAKAAVSSAWLSYAQLSSVVTAPIAGKITGLNLSAGLPITSSSSENGESSTILGTIVLEQGKLQANINLTEIDVTKVEVGQNVTLTMDAFPGKSFTGKVSAINTNGIVSSGVTTYPATITFDTAPDNVYPNMAVSAKIITDLKNDAVLVPSGAVQTANGQSTVRVMRERQIVQLPVEIGGSNDTQTEIISGIQEGETVVTSITNQNNAQNGQQTTSPFGGRGFGGGAFRPGGFGGGGRGDQH